MLNSNLKKVELKAVVSGNVQGVGFRAKVKHLASQLQLTGFVRNLPNGNVEICAQGDKESLSQLLINLKKEFSAQYIQNIQSEVHPISQPYLGFQIVS